MLLIAIALHGSPTFQATPPAGKADIIVTAPGRAKPLPTVTAPATIGALSNRITYENSQRIAKCAMRLPPSRLAAAIDGTFNSSDQREAQAWLVRLTATCNASPGIVSQFGSGGTLRSSASGESDLNSLSSRLVASGRTASENEKSAEGSLIYDYGAFLEAALHTYAPDISLKRLDTANPEVHARFNNREVSRNNKRLPTDFQYFVTAVCMVRVQPETATAIFRVPAGSAQEAQLRASMINGARSCVGNAKKVHVDPTQFRIYILDALYRWVLATRDVSTLLSSAKAKPR